MKVLLCSFDTNLNVELKYVFVHDNFPVFTLISEFLNSQILLAFNVWPEVMEKSIVLELHKILHQFKTEIVNELPDESVDDKSKSNKVEFIGQSGKDQSVS